MVLQLCSTEIVRLSITVSYIMRFSCKLKMTSSMYTVRGRCVQFSMTEFEWATVFFSQFSKVIFFLSGTVSEILTFSRKTGNDVIGISLLGSVVRTSRLWSLNG